MKEGPSSGKNRTVGAIIRRCKQNGIQASGWLVEAPAMTLCTLGRSPNARCSVCQSGWSGRHPSRRTPPVRDDLETQLCSLWRSISSPCEGQQVDVAFRLVRSAVAEAVFPAQDPIFSLPRWQTNNPNRMEHQAQLWRQHVARRMTLAYHG